LKSRKTQAGSDFAASMIHRGLTGVDWLAGLPGNPSRGREAFPALRAYACLGAVWLLGAR